MRAVRLTLRGRSLAEDLMTSACVIRRVTGQQLSEETGEYTPTYSTIYDGMCEFVFDSSVVTPVDGQGQLLTRQQPVVKLPIDGTAGVKIDDVGTLSAHENDPGMVGLEFRIAGLHSRTRATARRLPVEVLS